MLTASQDGNAIIPWMTYRPPRPRSYRKAYNSRWRRQQHALGPTFGTQVALASVLVAIIAWNAGPQITSTWTLAASSPDEVAQLQESAYYPNCDAARAAGAAPMHVGEPGYRDGMDGDGDGIACEPYRGW